MSQTLKWLHEPFFCSGGVEESYQTPPPPPLRGSNHKYCVISLIVFLFWYISHKIKYDWSVRIPVCSPYIEVSMDTSGPYALVKACTGTSGINTPTLHTGHTHTLHVTYTIGKHSLRARFTHAIYTICTRSTRTLYACTIYAPDKGVQSSRPNYVYNVRAQLTLTIYVLV